ncbi:MAG: acyl-CoA dehydrogenase family protein [Pseudomonadota bacterium]
MDFMLDDEEIAFRDSCRQFARESLSPLADRYGETDEVPREMVAAMAGAGLFALLLPEDMGGRGIKALPLCLAREVLAGTYCPADVTLAMQGLGGYPIFLAGTDQQRQKYLARVGRGELLTTFALTEPEAGSDINGMQSQARPEGRGFVLNGEKIFISNGHAADILVTFVRTPLPNNPRALSAFILEKGMPGLSVAERLKVTAPHDLVRLRYENLFVPGENLLGQVGQGFAIATQTLELFRVTVGAAALGIGQAAFDATLAHVRKRRQFGKALSEFQLTQMKLADMAMELDAARALVYRAAILKDRGGQSVTRQASIAKLYATEAAFRVVDQAVQMHGGIGVLKGLTAERLFREIRALRIYEGTSEIQRLIIASSLLKG